MDPYVGEIRVVPFNFQPKGWAFCDGQLLPLSQNTALFSLLGTTYGGDGKSNFALPNMQGNVPIHAGQGPGLSLYDLGEEFGSDTVTLLQSEMPAHSHGFKAGSSLNQSTPNGFTLGQNVAIFKLGSPTPTTTFMNPGMAGVIGSSFPHNNMMPYLTLNFIIALQGVFPPRT
jgi:microcystin-dependent protein